MIVMLRAFGSEEQKEFIWGILEEKVSMTFGLTEPGHGSDSTHLETTAVPANSEGEKSSRMNGIESSPPPIPLA